MKMNISPSNMLLITLVLAVVTSGFGVIPPGDAGDAYLSATDMMAQEAELLAEDAPYDAETLTAYWKELEALEAEHGPSHTWGYELNARWQEIGDGYGVSEPGYAFVLPEADWVPYEEAVALAIRGLEIKYGFDPDTLDLYNVWDRLVAEEGRDPYWGVNFFPKDMDREDVKIYLTEINAITGRYQFVYAGEYGYG